MTALSLRGEMARILGIDFGTKRMGFAVTDPGQIIVNPLEVVPADQAIGFLEDYLAREQVERFVCGRPGSQYQQTLEALDVFVQKLKAKFPHIPIAYQDEQMTSQHATGIILRSGARKMQRRDKGLVDQVSAVLILQEYLGHLKDVYLP